MVGYKMLMDNLFVCASLAILSWRKLLRDRYKDSVKTWYTPMDKGRKFILVILSALEKKKKHFVFITNWDVIREMFKFSGAYLHLFLWQRMVQSKIYLELPPKSLAMENSLFYNIMCTKSSKELLTLFWSVLLKLPFSFSSPIYHVIDWLIVSAKFWITWKTNLEMI